MAEPNRTPAGSADDPAAEDTTPSPVAPAAADDQEAGVGDPIAAAEPIERAATTVAPVAADDVQPAPTEPVEPIEAAPTTVVPVEADDVRASSARSAPAAEASETRAEPSEAPAESTEEVPPVPAPVVEQPVVQPAQGEPVAPKKGGNRLVGTAWVLLAAGLFEVLYFAAIGFVVLLLAGPQAVAPQLAQLAPTPFAWLPVLFFVLLFELTVLLFNRAGRFAYVVASLVVGVLVYVLSVVLILLLLGGDIGDKASLARAFESPEFVLIGLTAREVMLWVGFAIGARGRRVRKRNRAARDAYREELAERADAVS